MMGDENLDKNIAIAEFIGMQKTSLGWYDAEEILSLHYTTDNTFDRLLFDVSFDWLIPVGLKCSNLACLAEMDEWDYGIMNAASTFNIKILFKEIFDFITFYKKNPDIFESIIEK